MPESLPGCEQKGRRRGGGTNGPFCWPPLGFIPSTAWVGSQGSLPCLPPTPEHRVVPVLLRECSLEEQLPGFLPPTSTSLEEDSLLFMLVPGPLSRAPAGSQELLLMGCQGIWMLTAPCNCLLQLLDPPLPGQMEKDALTSTGGRLAPFSPFPRSLR